MAKVKTLIDKRERELYLSARDLLLAFYKSPREATISDVIREIERIVEENE